MLLVLLLATSCLANLEVGLQDHGQGYVGVSLTNGYPTAVTLLVWNTPFDDMRVTFREDMFFVSDDAGLPMRFDGVRMKRFPTGEDFRVLQAGETIDTAISIAHGYQLPRAGVYTVVLGAVAQIAMHEFMDLQTINNDVLAAEFKAVVLKSNALNITVSTPTPLRFWEVPRDPIVEAITWTSCTSARQTTVSQASVYCGNEADTATSCLNGLSCSTISSCPRYTTWFGACSSSNLQTVKDTYTSISSANKGNFGIDCSGTGCGTGTYAYVYANDATRTIHLCSAFWNAGTSKCACPTTDLQAGTLVHEFAHFTTVAGTSDYKYGTAAAKQLAIDNPNQAVKNSDNVEYFAEHCGC
jgi:peptidyl-Lys metalloendopeptidase